MTFRNFMKKIHLWVGVPVSILVAWIAFSGALLSFQEDIRRYVLYPTPEYTVAQGDALLTPHQLKARLLQQVPTAAQPVASAAPSRSNGRDQGGSKKPALSEVEYRAKGEAAVFSKGNPRSPEGQTLYFLHPYTGKLLATYTTANDIFRTIMVGHRWLWLPQHIGRPIVGGATILFVLLLISGLVMWLPKQIKPATLKHALSLSLKGSRATVTKRWHGTLGLYLSIFGLIFALTGLTWSFEWYRSAYNATWGLSNTRHHGPSSNTGPKSDTLSVGTQSDSILLGELFTRLSAELPIGQEGRTTFTFAHTPTDAYEVTYRHSIYSIAQRDTRTFDRYTLRPLQTKLYADKPLNERIAGSPYDLHTGGIAGFAGRLIYFIAAIAIASLPLTGLWIVLRRWRKKKHTTRHKA